MMTPNLTLYIASALLGAGLGLAIGMVLSRLLLGKWWP